MRNLLFFTLILMIYATAVTAQTRQGLLPIDQAYKLSVSIQSPGVVVVNWKIAPDYYLYRSRMKFMAGKGITLGKPKLPSAEKDHDQYLGDVEIYHNSVKVIIPYKASPEATSIHLTVGYQGCHEVKPKLCYPPTTKTFDLVLPKKS